MLRQATHIGLFVALKRLRNSVVHRPYLVMGILFLIPLAYLVIAPAFEIVRTSLIREGQFSGYYWQRVLSGRMSVVLFFKPLLNTLKLAFGMTAGSVVVGAVLAWLVVRTDLPMRGTMERLAVVPYIIPAWVVSLAWITAFRNSEQFGGAPGLLESFIGYHSPQWLTYGLVPSIITLSLHYFPYSFILSSSAFRSVDSHLEETGEVLGASRIRILRKITFPIILPALLSAVILTFAKGLGTFAVPAFLGPPVKFRVLSTIIYSMLNTGSFGEAYVIAIITTLIGALTIYMNLKIISARRSYATVSGKGMRLKPYKLGKWTWPVFGVVALFIFCAVVLPVLVLIWQSLMFYPGNFSINNLTLHFWIGRTLPELGDAGQPGILRNPGIIRAAWHSIELSAITATISALLGLLIGYVIVKAKGNILSTLLDQLSFLPYLMPALPFAATYILLFAHPVGPIPALYGTMALLVIICIVKRLPYSSRTGITSMIQISQELEETAVVLGAGWLRRFRKILFPIAKSGFIGVFLLSFITVMRELDLIILLSTPRTELITTMIFRFAEQGIAQFTNALALTIVIITLSVYSVIQNFQKGDMFGTAE